MVKCISIIRCKVTEGGVAYLIMSCVSIWNCGKSADSPVFLLEIKKRDQWTALRFDTPRENSRCTWRASNWALTRLVQWNFNASFSIFTSIFYVKMRYAYILGWKLWRLLPPLYCYGNDCPICMWSLWGVSCLRSGKMWEMQKTEGNNEMIIRVLRSLDCMENTECMLNTTISTMYK